MADETQGERTEPASPRKRREARESGQVGKSQDLNTAVILLAALLILNFLGGSLLEGLGALVSSTLANLNTVPMTVDTLHSYAGAGTLWLVRMLLPLLIGLFVLAIGISLLQVGPGLSLKVFMPKASRFNPISGLKRMFSSRCGVKLFMALIKVTIVGAVLYWTISDRLNEIVPTMKLSVGAILVYLADSCYTVGLRIAVALLILAILDYSYQRWKHEQDIKMTKQEVKDELRRYEGDPKIKERRLRAQRAIANQRMMQQVPQADVVVTNPTELAIALRYKREEMAAPRVVAKGAGYIARKIREIAVANGIPIVEKKPLAQVLYRTVQVGQEVPADLYQAVAEVLAYVYELGRQKAWAS